MAAAQRINDALRDWPANAEQQRQRLQALHDAAAAGGAGLNNDQLQELIRGVRPGPNRKLLTFEKTSGSEWRTWRNHFEMVVQINGWDAARCRREMKAAMMGEAARMTSDIDLGQNQMAAALNLYEARFMPPAASAAAKVEFHAICQLSSKTELQFHARARELFV